MFNWVWLPNSFEHNLTNGLSPSWFNLFDWIWLVWKLDSHKVWCLIFFNCRTLSNSIYGLSLISERLIDYARSDLSLLCRRSLYKSAVPRESSWARWGWISARSECRRKACTYITQRILPTLEPLQRREMLGYISAPWPLYCIKMWRPL